jgi:CBASS immunity sensor of nucleotide second messenger signals
MSVTKIPESVKLRLWGKAGGRCEYTGCNTSLWLDSLTKAEFNTAYLAHIYGDSPGGPRYEAGTSERLAPDITNLMLMCDEHHRLIDRAQVKEHPVERLQRMKALHEERIERLTAIGPELQSEPLLYCANVGEQSAAVTAEQAALAMTPRRYPSSPKGIAIGLRHSQVTDRDPAFWAQEREQLRRSYDRHVRPLVEAGGTHLSVFAVAPQPLLIMLGGLLSDIRDVDVYQLHREPTPTWRWDDEAAVVDSDFMLDIRPPKKPGAKTVAAMFELSFEVDPRRVEAVLGPDVAIWSLKLRNPGNDTLRTRRELEAFRTKCRELLAAINLAHPGLDRLHVFPVMPVAAAVELGRVRMPKADPPLRVYDELRGRGGFVPALDLPEPSL